MISSNKYGQEEEEVQIEFTDAERAMEKKLRVGSRKSVYNLTYDHLILLSD